MWLIGFKERKLRLKYFDPLHPPPPPRTPTTLTSKPLSDWLETNGGWKQLSEVLEKEKFSLYIYIFFFFDNIYCLYKIKYVGYCLGLQCWRFLVLSILSVCNWPQRVRVNPQTNSPEQKLKSSQPAEHSSMQAHCTAHGIKEQRCKWCFRSSRAQLAEGQHLGAQDF